MHFNFHLSGDESPEQSRRIASAVLALGGLLGAKTDTVQTHVIHAGEISPELRQALKDGASANVSVGYRVTEGVTRPTVQQELAASGLTEEQMAVLVKSPVFLDPSELSPPVDNDHVAPGCELFDGALTSNDIRAAESLPPAPPVPITSAVAPSGLDAKGLPWDERIHSSSRAINADGTWRYRKNVPDETKRDVEAELKGLVTGAVAGKGSYVITSVGIVDEQVLNDPNTVISPPLPPTPPAPPVPTGALQRTYSDVVNLIMARKVQPDTYVAILGMSLPEFAKHVISAPSDATLMFDALDAASRP